MSKIRNYIGKSFRLSNKMCGQNRGVGGWRSQTTRPATNSGQNRLKNVPMLNLYILVFQHQNNFAYQRYLN